MEVMVEKAWRSLSRSDSSVVVDAMVVCYECKIYGIGREDGDRRWESLHIGEARFQNRARLRPASLIFQNPSP